MHMQHTVQVMIPYFLMVVVAEQNRQTHWVEDKACPEETWSKYSRSAQEDQTSVSMSLAVKLHHRVPSASECLRVTRDGKPDRHTFLSVPSWMPVPLHSSIS